MYAGGACCWRPSESRLHKSLARVVCDRRMALIVDDSVDVWGGDLGNLCLTRRFVGDKLDDGLQLLSWQLSQAHAAFYANAPAEGYSLEAPSGSPRAPPTIFSVLGQARGSLLAGCKVCLTGIVTDLSEETLEGVPLGGLIQQFGGEMVLNVEHATHLVARRKDGWKASPKIRKAFARQQVHATAAAAATNRYHSLYTSRSRARAHTTTTTITTTAKYCGRFRPSDCPHRCGASFTGYRSFRSLASYGRGRRGSIFQCGAPNKGCEHKGGCCAAQSTLPRRNASSRRMQTVKQRQSRKWVSH